MTSARPPNAAAGKPPPITLPKVNRSGAPSYGPRGRTSRPALQRKPVITSSEISSAPCARGDPAQRLGEPGLGRDDAHVAGGRLGDDGGDLVAALGEHGLEGVDVVVRQDDRLGGARGPARPAESGRAKVATPEPAAASREST